MGGLNHRGIVGALAMTIQDPPRLIYDYYNGGDMRHFIDKCDKFRKSEGKSVVGDNHKFVMEKKVFLENRLGIAMALLETMKFLHGNDRVHCDLHDGNILLHFDYDHDHATKVYVGMCDFGNSKELYQCEQPTHRIFATPPHKVAEVRKKYPQLPLELVGPSPSPYSKATDVYMLGNTFETLLQATDHWDDMSKATRFLNAGWSAKHHAHALDDIIRNMMHKDPKKRMDCDHWMLRMSRLFPDCRLQLQNSSYLRD